MASASLVVPGDLALPRACAPFLAAVRLALHPTDAMYAGSDRHYLSCGASALNCILAGLAAVDRPPPQAILDFGSGAGRVTRWLRAAFPGAAIDACDLRAGDLDFLAAEFGARTWISGKSIADVQAPGRYDLVWIGSVATHLPAAATEALLAKTLSWTLPLGLVVMSLHGRFVIERQRSGIYKYVDDERWPTIVEGCERTGYGFAEYPRQAGYGISVSKPSWAAALVECMPGARLASYVERGWDGHHDVVAVQATASPRGAAGQD